MALWTPPDVVPGPFGFPDMGNFHVEQEWSPQVDQYQTQVNRPPPRPKPRPQMPGNPFFGPLANLPRLR